MPKFSDYDDYTKKHTVYKNIPCYVMVEDYLVYIRYNGERGSLNGEIIFSENCGKITHHKEKRTLKYIEDKILCSWFEKNKFNALVSYLDTKINEQEVFIDIEVELGMPTNANLLSHKLRLSTLDNMKKLRQKIIDTNPQYYI